MVDKLRIQMAEKKGRKLHRASLAYIEFLEKGGEILLEDLKPSLLKDYFKAGIPILAGLSATYLYQCSREYIGGDNRSVYDDINGMPTGHFVVLCGYNQAVRKVVVADPFLKNPISGSHFYEVGVHRLINSIMLGVWTYDANILVIHPKNQSA
jgi:hypothetical protein